ncbi:hypothetical protein RRG08_059805 [Elysia crispata]|uniref:Uncharacterized protein n=1 Tax=Elysia crispata TaxID=231223 RepID=A0AAE1EEK6_9GAST|nr:hypothetical protein RRG08_059805 [Elysia crispata]
MSGDYENTIEKWLMNSNGQKNSTAAHARQFESTSHERLLPPSSPPFLVDDDEEQETGEYFKNLGTGPPVLEPVLHHPHDRNLFDAVDKDTSKHSDFTAKQSSASDKKLKGLEKTFKTYSAYGNTLKSPLKKKNLENESQSEIKSTSGNIFDKLFSPALELHIDDSPPPLIPSLKAMAEDQQLSPQGGAGGKYAMKSPDFCAMEADSTSELQSSSKGQEHSEKKGNGELSLECDSTCMLGGSPYIVSPASNSTCGDMEEARDCGDGLKLHRTVEIQCNSDSLDEKPCAVEKSISKTPIILESNNCNTEGISTDIVKNPLSLEVNKISRPCLEDKSVEVDFTNSNITIGFSSEPPTLSVKCCTSNQQLSRRRQRHTVDSLEEFSKSRKISNSDLISSGPPPLICMEKSENTCFQTQSRPKGKKSKLSLTMKSKVSSNLKRPCYKRSITVPVTGNLNLDSMQYVHALWQLSQLQTRMHTLLSQLWPMLQLDMTPESPQFIVIIRDLITMLERPGVNVKCEEELGEPSSLLKSFPSDSSEIIKSSPGLPNSLKVKQPSPLFSSPEEQHSLQESSVSPDISSSHTHKAAVSSHEHTELIDNLSSIYGLKNCSHTSQITPHPSPSDLPPLLDESCSAGDPLIQSQTSLQQQQQHPVKTELKDSSNYQQNLPLCLSWNTAASSTPLLSPSDTECSLSGLSKLSLADGRELCSRPMNVVLPGDPDSLLVSFSSLSCKALQLLLPQVAVSLTNELSHSPKALIAFIDNVLAVNVKGKKSQKKKV